MKIILILFILNCSLTANQYYTFDLNSNLIDSYQISDNLYLIEGDMKSCLLYNSTTEEYKELYTNHQSKITSVELVNDVLCIGSGKDLTILNIRNNSFIKDSILSSSASEIFEYSKRLYIARTNGVIDEITLNYPDQSINYKRVDSLSKVVSKIEFNNKLYLLSADKSVYQFDGILKFIKKIETDASPNKIIHLNNKIYFLNKNQFEVFSEAFDFIERNSLIIQNYAIVNDGYYTSNLSGNTVILKRYDFEKNLIETNNYEIDKYFIINNIYSMFSAKDDIIMVGDKKLIVEFNRTNRAFLNRSAINLTKRLELGNISFANNQVGAYATNDSFLYITENGGATWKNIFKSAEMEKINYEFNYIKYFDTSSFIAFSNPYNGTFLSFDNGETYKNINNPSNNSAYDTPFMNKYNNLTIYSNSYYGLGTGYGLHISNYDEEFEQLKDTFLVGYYFLDAAMIEDELNIIVYERIGSTQYKYSIIRTDIEMSKIEHDTRLYNYERVFNIESIGNSYYIIASGKKEPEKQFLLKSDKGMSKLDTVKELDNKYYFDSYTNNNKLYLRDTAQRIHYYNEKSNKFEPVTALSDTVKFRMNVQIFDDVIFSSYLGALLKSINIPKFSEITDVSVEVVPSFYLHSVYPNPTRNILNVKLDYDQSLSLTDVNVKYYDITGAEISDNVEYNVNHFDTFRLEIQSDISKLNSGVYFIQLKFGNKIETRPFVIE